MGRQLILYVDDDTIAGHLSDSPEGLHDVLTGMAYALDDEAVRARFCSRFAEHNSGSVYDQQVLPFLDALAASLRAADATPA